MDHRDLVKEALKTFAITEIGGAKDNPEIMRMADELGITGAYPHDETAWCGLAMAAWVKRAGGVVAQGFLSARAWLAWGVKVENPETLDLVVFWRNSRDSWEGHVGMFIARMGDYIYVLGGNQDNKVCITTYPASRVLGYRRAV